MSQGRSLIEISTKSQTPNNKEIPMVQIRNFKENPFGYLAGKCLKGHNTKGTSFARFLLATACPGSPGLWPESFTLEFGAYLGFEICNLDFNKGHFHIILSF